MLYSPMKPNEVEAPGHKSNALDSILYMLRAPGSSFGMLAMWSHGVNAPYHESNTLDTLKALAGSVAARRLGSCRESIPLPPMRALPPIAPRAPSSPAARLRHSLAPFRRYSIASAVIVGAALGISSNSLALVDGASSLTISAGISSRPSAAVSSALACCGAVAARPSIWALKMCSKCCLTFSRSAGSSMLRIYAAMSDPSFSTGLPARDNSAALFHTSESAPMLLSKSLKVLISADTFHARALPGLQAFR